MAAKKRSDRVSELIRQIISEAITFRWNSANAKKVTVQRVVSTDNIRSMKVYVSIMGAPEDRPAIVNELTDSKGFFKQEIGKQTRIRFMPELNFILDETLDKVDRISALLKSVKTDNDGKN